MKKANDLIIHEEELSYPPPPHEIPEATPVDIYVQVNEISAPEEESETPNKEEPEPVITVPLNLEEVISAPPDADK